ncbi:MAG: glycosyltransferase family 39 protein [Candidatus Omnitrophica bacterium]|nr:glycosyltransferase family 39 protein [Candidatus Omnitrophota bacterium]MBU4487803.1 glycosyltransferase family 39 protein [Candidatus Omnitrophota bacterium]MCG2705557.1 glycosyltransferase family 39 protein [Candidatus Omnitrophota bacterium]
MKLTDNSIKILLFAVCAIMFLYHLGSALPIIEMEKFYFQSVKEMFSGHDWITPYYHGQFRFAKPILFYWCVSLSYIVFGINNFAARFPSAVFAIFTIILTYSIGRRLFNQKTGLLAALMAATFPIFFMYARYSSPDIAMTFLITFAMYLFIRKSFIPFFVVLGLAMATKGPLGFIIPLVAVSAYMISTKDRATLKSMNMPLGIAIIAAIGLPWYILMYKLHGDVYLNHIIAKEALERMFYSPGDKTGSAALLNYAKHFFDYVPALLAFFIPHSLFLPASLIDAFKNKKRPAAEKDSYKLVLSFFLTIFVLFTLISSKIYHYMLPISPFFAILVAAYLTRLEESGSLFKSPNFRVMYTLVIITYSLGITVLLYTMRHLYPAQVPLYNYGLIFVPLLLAVPYWKKKGSVALFAIPLATAIVMIFFAGKALPLLNDNSLSVFADEIKVTLKEGDRVGVGSMDISQQRLGLYLNMRIEEVNVKWKDTEKALPAHRQKLEQFINSGAKVYLVISEDDYKKAVPDELKPKLLVLDERDTWKSRLKNGFKKDTLRDILNGKKDLLRDVLRHKLYLLTNK